MDRLSQVSESQGHGSVADVSGGDGPRFRCRSNNGEDDLKFNAAIAVDYLSFKQNQAIHLRICLEHLKQTVATRGRNRS